MSIEFKELNIWHVYPNNDKKEHIIQTIERYDGKIKCSCDCNPRVEYQLVNDGVLVIHNSFDGREGVEWASEIISVRNESF